MKKYFSRFETFFYFSGWIFCVLYSMYRFAIKNSSYFNHYKDEYNDFKPGWSAFNEKQDTADLEWTSMNFYLPFVVFGSIFLCCFAEVLKQLQINIVIIQFCHILVSTVFIIYNFGFAPVIFIYLELFIYLFLNKLGFVLFYWIFTVIFVYALDCIRNFIENDVFLPFIKFSLPQLHVLNLITTWSILKCISFNIDNADKKITVNHLLDYFAYILYFPNLFLGPFLPYKSFERGLKIAPDLKFRILALIQNLARCFFWFFLIHIFLHFVYINATIFHLEFIKSLDSWELYGYGYTMAQYFHVKYVFSYGLSTSFASFENMDVPNLPRCIGRIHLYSNMWKYFDIGLYNFLVRYIYVPTIKKTGNKLLSSFFCFTFIYLWHGLRYYILVWTAINFFGIVLEMVTAKIYDSLKSRRALPKFSRYILRNLECLLATPLLGFSAISNFYFFSDEQIGWIFFANVFNDTFTNNFVLFLALFSCCQVSSRLKNVESHKN